MDPLVQVAVEAVLGTHAVTAHGVLIRLTEAVIVTLEIAIRGTGVLLFVTDAIATNGWRAGLVVLTGRQAAGDPCSQAHQEAYSHHWDYAGKRGAVQGGRVGVLWLTTLSPVGIMQERGL